MGELENAWKTVTNAFKSLGSELKDQYEKATSDDRPADEIAADRKGKAEVAAALDPASDLRDDLKSDEDQEAALAAVSDEDVSSAFDRARHYLEQAASTVGKVAKEDSTKKAAKDAATAMGDALSATFAELKKALKMDDDDEEKASTDEADAPSEDQSEDSGGSNNDGGSNGDPAS